MEEEFKIRMKVKSKRSLRELLLPMETWEQSERRPHLRSTYTFPGHPQGFPKPRSPRSPRSRPPPHPAPPSASKLRGGDRPADREPPRTSWISLQALRDGAAGGPRPGGAASGEHQAGASYLRGGALPSRRPGPDPAALRCWADGGAAAAECGPECGAEPGRSEGAE